MYIRKRPTGFWMLTDDQRCWGTFLTWREAIDYALSLLTIPGWYSTARRELR